MHHLWSCRLALCAAPPLALGFPLLCFLLSLFSVMQHVPQENLLNTNLPRWRWQGSFNLIPLSQFFSWGSGQSTLLAVPSSLGHSLTQLMIDSLPCQCLRLQGPRYMGPLLRPGLAACTVWARASFCLRTLLSISCRLAVSSVFAPFMTSPSIGQTRKASKWSSDSIRLIFQALTLLQACPVATKPPSSKPPEVFPPLRPSPRVGGRPLSRGFD